MSGAAPVIRALLWDADGVLQHSPGTWREALDEAGGPGFAEAVFEAELPALRGEEPLTTALDRVLAQWPQASADVAMLLGLWERAVVDADSMTVVDEVRSRGVLCALATNQQDHRRAWMRDVLGQDERFDRVFYSCELNLMKPDPAYFECVVDELGLAPGQVGFVDDSQANVDAARGVGLVALRHDPGSGAEALRREVESLLAGAG